MNERLKDLLHRWLPKLAILSVLVMLSSYLFAEYYVRPRFDDCGKGQEKHEIAHTNQATRASGRASRQEKRGQSRLRTARRSHRYARRQQSDPSGPERSSSSRRSRQRAMGDQCSRPHCVLRSASSPGTQRLRFSSRSPNPDIEYGSRRCAFALTTDRSPVTCGNRRLSL